MLDRAVFYDRLENFCKRCPHWHNVCLKGHGLASADGCPLKAFPPADGADYAVDRQAESSAPGQARNCSSGCGDPEMPALGWAQVLASFTKSMAEWLKAGMPLVSSGLHGARYGQCRACPQFRRFYCAHCRCLAYAKTKLATEKCPLPEPRWVSATAPGA